MTRRWITAISVLASVLLAASFALAAIAVTNASETSRDAQDLAEQIQRERARNIQESCEETNRRHDATIASLDAVIAGLPPSRRARAREGRAGTVLLIEALAPYRNCDALVRQQVGTP